MSWFGNRNREGNETEKPEVKPRNQILQIPEKQTPEAKAKLDKYQNKTPEEKQKIQESQSKIAKDHTKLDRPNTSTEGDTTKGQRIKEKGNETQMER